MTSQRRPLNYQAKRSGSKRKHCSTKKNGRHAIMKLGLIWSSLNQLKKELTHFDLDMSFEDQLSNLKYLKSINVIEQRQFGEIREELRGRHLIK